MIFNYYIINGNNAIRKKRKKMKKRYCEYCGALLSDGCDCEKEIEQEKEELIEELENRQELAYQEQERLEWLRNEN